MEHIISFKSLIEEFEIKKPRWWQFWKTDEVISHETWKPFSIVVSKDELELIRNDIKVFHLLIKSLTGVISATIANYTVEKIPYARGYINPEHKKEKVFKNRK